jgi:D-xylose transport system substrate-binding protein
MKKCALSVLALMIILVLLAGCKEKEEQPVKEEEKVQIGMIFDTFVVERWLKDRDVFVSAVKELGGEVDVQNANGDVQNQIDQMKYFIDRKVDVIVIVPIDPRILSPYVERAHRNGIKVISYDRILANANTDLYISFDNEYVGTLMAKELRKVISRGDKALMICGPQTDLNVFSVQKGFEETMEAQGMEILDIYYADGWKAEEAGRYIDENLDKVKEVKAIMCGNDNLAWQVIQKLSEYQLAQDIYVTGQDADLGACQRIVEGNQYMTVYKSIESLAKEAAKAAMEMAAGKEVQTDDEINDGAYNIPFLKLTPVSVTADNMDEVIIDSGFHRREDVYLNRPDLLMN